MYKKLCLAMAGLCLYPAAVPAQPWSGNVDLGYSATSGNTDTQSLNAKLGLAYQAGPWLHEGSLRALRSRKNGSTDAERYQFGAKTEFSLGQDSYLFGSLDIEHDEFGGIRDRGTLAGGYGWHLLRSEPHLLSVEAGPGFRRQRLQTGERDGEAIGRVALDYAWTISPSSRFSQTLLLEAGSSDTYTESVSSLKLAILGNLAAKFSYTVKHHAEVPAGREKTDTYSLIALSYEFGKAKTP